MNHVERSTHAFYQTEVKSEKQPQIHLHQNQLYQRHVVSAENVWMHVCACGFMLSLCVHRCLLNYKTHSSGWLHIDHAELALLLNKIVLSLIYQEHSLHYCHSHLTPVPDIHKHSHIHLTYPRHLNTSSRHSPRP